MGEEKAANPFLRADVPEVAKAVGMAGAPAAEVFAEIRDPQEQVLMLIRVASPPQTSSACSASGRIPRAGTSARRFRDQRTVDGRAASTAIYFLLARGERSHWHRVDAAEVWHYYAGAPLRLEIAERATVRSNA